MMSISDIPSSLLNANLPSQSSQEHTRDLDKLRELVASKDFLLQKPQAPVGEGIGLSPSACRALPQTDLVRVESVNLPLKLIGEAVATALKASITYPLLLVQPHRG
jgi:hypothetical protein